MAEYARRVRDLGASLIGGCCGNTPEHIARMAEALAQPVGRVSNPTGQDVGRVSNPAPPTPPRQRRRRRDG